MELSPKQQIREIINKSNDILIVFKENAAGDDFGSALALDFFLKRMGKKTCIAAACSLDNKFKFLDGYANIQNSIAKKNEVIISVDTKEDKIDSLYYKNEENRLNVFLSPKEKLDIANISICERKANFDLIIVLNSPDLESLGKIYEENTNLFFQTPILNIDRHSSNEYFGQINLVEITAAATSEIIYNLAKYLSLEISGGAAMNLLAGIIDNSDNFLASYVTPATFLTASDLVLKGADREKIIRYLYKTKSLASLKMWGRVMAKLNYDALNKLAWTVVSEDDFKKTNANFNDIKFSINEISDVSSDINLIVIFYNKTGQDFYGLLQIVENHLKKGQLLDLVSILNGRMENNKEISFSVGGIDKQAGIQEVLQKLKIWMEK